MDSNESNENNNNLIGEEIRHRQISALVPEHVSTGVFSTGAIVTQGPHEFVVDFLLSMNRPHRVAARVVLPPIVLAQVINALQDNIRKYETRFGPADPARGYASEDLKAKQQGGSPAGGTAKPASPAPPGAQQGADEPALPGQTPTPDAAANSGQPAPASDLGAPSDASSADDTGHTQPPRDDADTEDHHAGPSDLQGLTPLPPRQPGDQNEANPTSSSPQPGASKSASQDDGMMSHDEIDKISPAGAGPQNQNQQNESRPSVQDVYDDLKIEDHVMSGSYANAVMIGHSTGEFFFDFITNFFPRSAVSCRVYVSARQVPRLLDAFKYSFQRYQNRLRQAQQQQQQQQRRRQDPPSPDNPIG